MKKHKYVIFLSIGLITIIYLLFLPIFPWPIGILFNLRRVTAKTATMVFSLQNKETHIISITGKLKGNGALKEALKGAEIIALESASGYTSLSDKEGYFTIPHLIWYPGAKYSLVISANDFHTRLISISSPNSFSSDTLNIGELNFDLAIEITKHQTIFRAMKYDKLNDLYYKNLFEKLTANINSDEEKIQAINKYVASKLNYNEPAKSFPSPKEILERGSCYCSNLALAMAAITSAGNYPTRTVHLTDTANYLNTHVTVEVYYKEKWHLYDPTYGIFFLNEENQVASYRELRLNTSLINSTAFQDLDAKLTEDILKWMPGAFNSGFHQLYLVKRF